jgi:hypothetical protein
MFDGTVRAQYDWTDPNFEIRTLSGANLVFKTLGDQTITFDQNNDGADLTIDTSGNATFASNLTISGRTDTPAHTNNTGLNLPTNAGAPAGVTGTAEGDIVWDSTNDALYVYNGAAFAAIGGGGYTGWTLQGDTGSNQTISSTDVVDFTGGTGIDTIAGTPADGLTINFDSTELGTTTWFDGTAATDIVWTFNGETNDGIFGYYEDEDAFSITTAELGIGTTDPGAWLNVLGTTEQLRLSYDASNYTSFTIDSAGNLAIADTGTSVATFGAAQASFAVPASFNAAGDASFGYDLVLTNQSASKIDAYGPLTIRSGESHENNNLNLTVYGTGNVVANLGTSGAILPGTDDLHDLGSSSFRFDDVYATNGTIQTSDVRFKENITLLSYGLDTVRALRPVSFTWKTKPERGTKLGLIAQEVREVIPELVIGGSTPDELLGINYAEFAPVLIAGIQELALNQDALTAAFAGLEVSLSPQGNLLTQVTDLTNQVSQLAHKVSATDLSLSSFIQGQAESIDTQGFSASFAQIDALVAQEATISALVVEDATVSGVLVADNIRSKRLDELEARLAQMEQQEVASEPAPETTVAPDSDTSDTSDTSSLDLDDLTAMLDASTSALLAEAVSVDPETLTTEGDLTGIGSIEALIVSDFLSVGGETVLTQAQVTTNLKVGTDAAHLSLSSTSIATTCSEGTTECATLYLQPQGGRLNLLAGLMTLDDTGTVTINGNLLVNGTITTNELAFGNSSLVDRRSSILGSTDSRDLTVQLATGSAFLVRGYETTDPNSLLRTSSSEPLASIDASGSARFVDLATNQLKIKTGTTNQISDTVIENQASAGSATIPAGVTQITLQNQRLSDNSLIYVTPLSSTQNQVLFVKEQVTCTQADITANGCVSYAVIGFEAPIAQSVKFNWWIVAVEE